MGKDVRKSTQGNATITSGHLYIDMKSVETKTLSGPPNTRAIGNRTQKIWDSGVAQFLCHS